MATLTIGGPAWDDRPAATLLRLYGVEEDLLLLDWYGPGQA